MAALSFRITVRAPREKVFDFISNGENAPQWHGSIRSARHTAPLPIRRGSHLVLGAKLGRRQFSWVQEVSGWDPPTSFEDRMIPDRSEIRKEEPGPPPFRTFVDSCELRDVPGGTEVLFGVKYGLPYGPLGTLLDLLVFRTRVRTETEQSLQRLKTLLESPA